MLYYHTEAQRQLIKERHQQLAQEMRRARRPTHVASWRILWLATYPRTKMRRLRLKRTRSTLPSS